MRKQRPRRTTAKKERASLREEFVKTPLKSILGGEIDEEEYKREELERWKKEMRLT